MNSPSRFDLEKAIAAWRRTLVYNRAFLHEDCDELERHVRDQAAALVKRGLTEAEAFRRTLDEMGDYGAVEAEYRKVFWGKRRRRRELANEFSWRFSMLKNYFKIALRNFKRQKGYSFINIAGLTLGMACCLLLFQYVAYETSFDQFHTKKERIFRAAFDVTQRGVGQGVFPFAGYIFGPTMAQEVPGIARYTRYHLNYGGAVVSYQSADGDRTFTERSALFVDTTFLSLFDYPLVHGDRTQALRRPQTLLLSASAARKYFGEEEAVGKAVAFTGWVQDTYTVAGVFEDVPPTSHLQFDVLLPMEDLLADGRFEQGDSPWEWRNFITYFELEPNADLAVVEAQLTETYARYMAESFARSQTQATASLTPLTDIHLGGRWAPATVTGNRRTVYFFTLIGLITLVIALVNYVNLATARAMDRAREVGVRKVVGAQQRQLVSQFLMESALMNLLALGLAVGLALMLLPVVNQVAGVEMSRSLWLDGRFWAVFLGIFGAGALLSGVYPAFVLSSFRPVAALKGKGGGVASRVSLRRGLVVVQFAASIALLAGTLIVQAQLSHMRNLDTGLDLEQVLFIEEPKVRAEGSDRVAEMATLKNELRHFPAVREAAISKTTPGWGFDSYTRAHRATADPSTSQAIGVTPIDADFASVYGLELAAGEGFREGMARPDSGAVPVLVNETLIRTLGFASNEEAVGAWITIGTDGSYVIRGVFEDFLWSSARREAEAAMFMYGAEQGHISLKVNTTDLPETIAAIEATYKTLFPGNPFTYHFADAAFDGQYKADQRFATLFAGFAGIAILIACLGLFGLASFTAQQRTKEIGVRKVLGASVAGIVALLSKDFLKLVGLAFVVAVPLAYVGMQRWLDGFAYRIEIGPGLFVLTGGFVLFIALATVGYQAIKSALADPVKSLRYE